MKNNMTKAIALTLSFLLCLSLMFGTAGCKKETSIDTDSVVETVSDNIVDSSKPTSSATADVSSGGFETSSATKSKESYSSVNNASSSSSKPVTSSEPEQVIFSTDPDYYDPLRPWYNIGYSKQLRGTPVIYAIFMDDDESTWDVASIETFLSYEIDPAVAYLENEAEKWGVDLDLTVFSFATAISEEYTFKYEGVVNRDLRSSPSTKDVLIKAAEDFGYSSEEELQEAISARHGGREIIFLCVLNKDGTSYTRNQSSNGSTVLVEETILFRRPLGYPQAYVAKGQRASVVAHEVLHQFGAEDFYVTSSREALANEYYPDDIMLWQYNDIMQNTLGDCVAYSIGWTDTVPQVCYNEKWWQ